MNKFLRNFDLYKKPLTLPIQSQHKYSNLTGFSVSTLTYIIFTLHLYLESYEVFVRERPNVLSNKNNINYSKSSSLNISSETLMLFLSLGEEYENDLSNYFQIQSFYSTNSQSFNGQIEFANCTSENIANLSKHSDVYKYTNGTKLCPKTPFFIPANSISRFVWDFTITECFDETKGCKRDEDLYEKVKKDKKFAKLYFIDFQENMLNYTHPYDTSYFSELSHYPGQTLNILLKGSEIKTQSLFGFYQTESRLKISKTEYVNAFADELFGYRILFSSKGITFYQRVYKTFVGSLANAYSLFKLYSWVFSILLSRYYSYNINNIIINKNFDYENSINNSNEIIKRKCSINSFSDMDSNQNAFLKEYKIDTTKSKRLTLALVYRKVSCCRLFLCNRKNLTKRFYDSTRKIIDKQLSIEQLLFCLVEFFRVKNFVVEQFNLCNLNGNERLALDLTINQEGDMLGRLLNNSVDNVANSKSRERNDEPKVL
jgi:hypothetical protein